MMLSMTEKDPNYIPKLEKAIAQRYGEEAINNPRQFWDDNKEKDYIAQSREEQRKFAKLAVLDIHFVLAMICT